MCLTSLLHANWTFFFHLNCSIQLLSELYIPAFLKNHYLQTCAPFIFLPKLFYHWNRWGISVIPNPACLHSTSCLLQSGQFLFYQSRHQRLRSCVFRYIRIGNLILCQASLSSPYRQAFHICIQTAEGWLHLSRDAWTCTGENAAAQLSPFSVAALEEHGVSISNLETCTASV